MIDLREWFKNPPESIPESAKDILVSEIENALKTVVVSDTFVYIFPYDGDTKNLGKVNVLISDIDSNTFEDRVMLFKGGHLNGEDYVLDPKTDKCTFIQIV